MGLTMEPAESMWRMRSLVQTAFLVLLAYLQLAQAEKRSFTLPLHSKGYLGADVSFRRKLLRNTTLPLHGAVKDYG